MNDDIPSARPDLPLPDEGLPVGQFDVVSAVLDGVASETESSMVAASPELGALLDDLRAARASIGTIDVPPAARTAALAAAMAVFDDLQLAAGTAAGTAAEAAERLGPDAAAAVTAPSDSAGSSRGDASNVVRIGRRQRQYRAVLGTAAAVVVLFVGVVMVRGLGGDDAEMTSFEAPASVVESGRSIEAAPTMGDAMTATEIPATELPATGDATAGNTTAGDTTAASPLTEMTPVDSGAIIDSIDSGAAVLDRVNDEASLRTWAAARPTPKSVASSTCITGRDAGRDAGRVELGTVLHLGTLAVVVRTVDSGALQVLELSTCATLLEATP